MPNFPRPHRAPVPEALSVIAIGGIAWMLWPPGGLLPASPPEPLRCDHPEAPVDCFVSIPGGAFLMGAQAHDPAAPGHDPDAAPHEGPPHPVQVTGFWIMRTEATVGTWRACVADGGCDPADVATGGGFSTLTAAPTPESEVMPLNSVSWQGAADLCAWLGGRLPTEAEWEYAARGADGRRWPWGDHAQCARPPDDDAFGHLLRAAVTSCQQDGPHRADDLRDVGPFGLIGAAGNLWEWTADRYAPDAYAGRGADRATLDPPGPEAGEARAQRGGSWMATTPAELRVTVRGGLDPQARLNDVGVRCALGGAW